MTEPYPVTEGPIAGPHRRRWVIPVVLVSVLVVVGLLLIAAFGIAGVIQNLGAHRAPDQPFVEGEPASPVAASPLDCAGQCFTESAVETTLAAADQFVALGLEDTTFPFGTYPATTVADLYRRDATSWKAYDGSPGPCFFAPSSAPYASSLGEADSDSVDLVYFTGTHEDIDRVDVMDQSARVFADSNSATAYLADLAKSIQACDEIAIGPASDRYFAELRPQPALELPDSIAAVGWIRIGDPGPRWRAYAVEMQRGNLVVMTRLITDGSINEYEFRSFVERYARDIEKLQPTVAASSSP